MEDGGVHNLINLRRRLNRIQTAGGLASVTDKYHCPREKRKNIVFFVSLKAFMLISTAVFSMMIVHEIAN